MEPGCRDPERPSRPDAAVGPELAWSCDAEGRCTGTGSALEALGIEPVALHGEDLLEVYRTDRELEAAVRHALSGSATSVRREIDGRPALLTVQPQYGADGAIA